MLPEQNSRDTKASYTVCMGHVLPTPWFPNPEAAMVTNFLFFKECSTHIQADRVIETYL